MRKTDSWNNTLIYHSNTRNTKRTACSNYQIPEIEILILQNVPVIDNRVNKRTGKRL